MGNPIRSGAEKAPGVTPPNLPTDRRNRSTRPPVWWYHHEDAPEGRLFHDGADCPDGWVDTPGKFPSAQSGGEAHTGTVPNAILDIMQVMRDMPPSDANPDAYTSEGIPRVEYLEHALGRDVSASERDKALEYLTAA